MISLHRSTQVLFFSEETSICLTIQRLHAALYFYGKNNFFFYFRNLIEDLKHKLEKERFRRRKIEKKLLEIKEKLKYGQFVDFSTLSNIEECFQKFMKFMNSMTSKG